MMSRKWDIACMGKEARKNKVSATLSGAYTMNTLLIFLLINAWSS